MQIAFIKLTGADRETGYGVETTELWVNVQAVTQVGVADGFTFVETSTGCSWVKETPPYVLGKISDVVNLLED